MQDNARVQISSMEVLVMPENYSMSRRRFAQLLGVGAAAMTTRPSFALPVPAAERLSVARVPATMVRLNSNENPYGTSPMAVKAMTKAFDLAWR